jgi:hypothetical protein
MDLRTRARLLLIAKGQSHSNLGVTGVTRVTIATAVVTTDPVTPSVTPAAFRKRPNNQRVTPVTPVTPEKLETNQDFDRHGVTSGVSLGFDFELIPDIGEREAIAIHEGRIAAAYAAAFAAIQSQIPNGVSRERWHLAVNDAGIFLDVWGELAERLGWTADDLFGINPSHPLVRYDAMGLIWFLKGQTVTVLHRETAVLLGGLKYRRRHSLAAFEPNTRRGVERK